MAADRIRVTGIQIRAAHGVYPQEKLNPQPFLIDLDCRLAPRPDSDDLSTTVNYADLIERVVAVSTGESVDLIETLAEMVAGACLDQALIEEVEVTVHKPAAPLAVAVSDVAVTITRRRT